MSFADLALDEVLCKAIYEAFGINTPTDIQKLVLSALLDEDARTRDVLVRSKTGSGKTLAFCLPILHHLLRGRREEQRQTDSVPRQGNKSQKETSTLETNPVRQSRVAHRTLGTLAIIVVPTRELALQTQEMLTKLLSKLRGRDHWLVSTALSGGDRRKSEKERLRRGVHLVIGTPGRLLDHLQKTAAWKSALAACRWLVVDEADRLLDAGFDRSMREIVGILKERTGGTVPQMILCSATVNEQAINVFGHALKSPLLIVENKERHKEETARKDHVRDQASSEKSRSSQDDTGSHNAVIIPSPQANPSSLEHFYCCTPTKFRLVTLLGMLTAALSSKSAAKVVLFTICCDTVDFLHGIFTEHDLTSLLPAQALIYRLHGGMEQKERLASYGAFSRTLGRPSLLICTDVAARGLNLTGVTEILQYDAPCDLADYVHRAGRTARADSGNTGFSSGRSTLFLMPSEKSYVDLMQARGLFVKNQPWEGIARQYLASQEAADATKTPKDNKRTICADDDDDETLADSDLRGRNVAWLERLQERLGKRHLPLLQLAQKAYLSFVRAYATHPAGEKSIFHPRKLHLGHLAATFLLAEAPKSVAMHKSEGRRGRETEAAAGKETGKLTKQQKRAPSNHDGPRKKRPLRFVRNVSEFAAGDALAAFMQPRKARKV